MPMEIASADDLAAVPADYDPLEDIRAPAPEYVHSHGDADPPQRGALAVVRCVLLRLCSVQSL